LVARHPGAGDDEGDPDLAPAVVGDPDDHDVTDAGVAPEHLLDLGGGDVLPAGDVDVLQPVDDPQVAVLVAGGDVPGGQPAVPPHRGGGLRVAEVARECARPADQQLSGAGALEVLAGGGI